ncbi:flagellin N-methylase [Andreesenia angusta]|uniref:Flagellin N-methylase n=1 Tax=Andreesenia angusta TaxID=39480 RepID=A0A1S1V6L7_9FIRM|nr:YkgJ family cysteine cluster protein [Andreesenia angusta]OHW62154.1 flagellin N-methylase [Andreesenia angusta]
MIKKKEMLKLYRTLDKYQEKLRIQDPYWEKCSPCKNKGQCCINSTTMILNSESTIIKSHIKKLDEDIKEVLRHNIDNDILCPFRDEKGCMIHDVRPFICRITPYTSSLNNNSINKYKIGYLVDSSDCMQLKTYEQDIEGSDLIKQYKSQIFADLPISDDGKTRKYLNSDYLKKNDKTHLKVLQESGIEVIDFLKREYKSLFKE